jgi:hypothetical protein
MMARLPATIVFNGPAAFAVAAPNRIEVGHGAPGRAHRLVTGLVIVINGGSEMLLCNYGTAGAPLTGTCAAPAVQPVSSTRSSA